MNTPLLMLLPRLLLPLINRYGDVFLRYVVVLYELARALRLPLALLLRSVYELTDQYAVRRYNIILR